MDYRVYCLANILQGSVFLAIFSGNEKAREKGIKKEKRGAHNLQCLQLSIKEFGKEHKMKLPYS